MDELINDRKERYILVAVSRGEPEKSKASLDELERLLDTAGGEVARYQGEDLDDLIDLEDDYFEDHGGRDAVLNGRLIQNIPVPGRASYIGKGKVEELNRLIEYTEADGIICDDELSPAQLTNLSEMTGVKVLDRTMLILDIFAAHATTKEGKVQVEAAQLRYRMSRLAGSGKALSRLGGGIGTRGPGEKKIESDRRVIRKRMKILDDEISVMKRVRETTRKKRMANAVPTVALVGYTNAGKSSLLNLLTDSEVTAEDKLFATLDPSTRAAVIPGGQRVIFTDTVGFISRLPHDLVDAFRSTLEEARYADILIHVADASDPRADEHTLVVHETLRALDIKGKPVLTVWNKADLLPDGDDGLADGLMRDTEADAQVMISAKTGYGIEGLFRELDRLLRESRVKISVTIPYSKSALLAEARQTGQIVSESYEADGIRLEAYVPEYLSNKIHSIDNK